MADTTTKTLPQPTWPAGFQGQIGADAYTADQMRAYAAAALAAQAQGEPVACVTLTSAAKALNHLSIHNGPGRLAEASAMLHLVPRPAAQPVRQPLTDERITQCWGESQGTRNGYVPFARAVERAHGIGQEGGAA